MNVQIKVFPASNGESILVKCTGNKITNILIDCGYVSTYKTTINKELQKLKANNEKIDLMVLTHIDNDHINGARCIFEDYIKNKICEISEVWYNDYFSIYDIEGCSNEKSIEEEFKLLKSIIKQKYPNDPNLYGEKVVGYNTANILVDYLQHKKICKKLNTSFRNGIFIEHKSDIKSTWLNNEVKIILLGPKKEVLVQFLNEWKSYLKKKGFKKEVCRCKEIAKAFELFYVNKIENINSQRVEEKQCSVNTRLEQLLEFNEVDTNLQNRSSISFIIKFYDKLMLFLGDSSPLDYDDVLVEIVQTISEEKLRFDLVKVPHHGSKYNISKKFFDIARSDIYIISTNGYRHNHPDFEAISKMICNQKENKLIKFNYKQNRVNNFINKNKLNETNNFKIEYENTSLLGKKVMEIEIKGEKDE